MGIVVTFALLAGTMLTTRQRTNAFYIQSPREVCGLVEFGHGPERLSVVGVYVFEIDLAVPN